MFALKKSVLIFLFLAISLGLGFGQSEKPFLFQQPTLSKTQVVFAFAGDLWIVGREGGEARRLTSAPGNSPATLLDPLRLFSMA